ncbi:Uu.00g144690.m01.CDS01 [Anthostomella pinea]|uniref:Uu.00g144690.m01.CDS01 n=1 Tax=Anthostomella pinea TaxID=933095 RepID=A0AAI8VQX5_9PEZI|nr:Uu.00g144690.m01.CDS01 [Anthostomella pinea]
MDGTDANEVVLIRESGFGLLLTATYIGFKPKKDSRGRKIKGPTRAETSVAKSIDSILECDEDGSPQEDGYGFAWRIVPDLELGEIQDGFKSAETDETDDCDTSDKSALSDGCSESDEPAEPAKRVKPAESDDSFDYDDSDGSDE